jgi:hypothetical protein
MRLTAMALSLAVAAASGCKPPPKEKVIDAFKAELRLYFNTLNNEAQARKEGLRREQLAALDNPALPAPSGMVYSTFTWDEGAYVVANYPCRGCGTKLLIPAPAAEYLCRACGHSPYEQHPPGTDLSKSPCTICVGPEHKPRPPNEDLISKETLSRPEGAAVKDMFEVTEDNPEKPYKAKVRYVRRSWSYDPRGAVKVSTKALEKSGADAGYIPIREGAGEAGEGPGRYAQPGFHRLDSVYVGEIEFQFKGGTLMELSRPPEEPVRPWKDLRPAKK